MEEFLASFIDQDRDTGEHNVDQFQNMIVDHEIIELKTNHIPKGLVPLEILYDNKDVCVQPCIQALEGTAIDFNISSDQEPKLVKILR